MASSSSLSLSKQITTPPLVRLSLCAVCKQPAEKCCSRCKNMYYCCVEHQKSDWKRHKNNDCIPTECLEGRDDKAIIKEMFQRAIDRVAVRKAFCVNVLKNMKEDEKHLQKDQEIEIMRAFQACMQNTSERGASVMSLCAALPESSRDKEILKMIFQNQSGLLVEATEARLRYEQQEFNGEDYQMLIKVTRDYQVENMAAFELVTTRYMPDARYNSFNSLMRRKIKSEIAFVTNSWPAHLAEQKANLAKLYRKLGFDFIQSNRRQHLNNLVDWQLLFCKMEFLIDFEVERGGSYVLIHKWLIPHPHLCELWNKIGRVFEDLIMVFWAETIQVLKHILGQPMSYVARKRIPGWEKETEQWLREANDMVGEINTSNFLGSLVHSHLHTAHQVEDIRAFMEQMSKIWARFLQEE